MASLCKKVGSTGKLSPYWNAVLSFQRRKIWVSTRTENKREARQIGDRWSSACRLAQRHKLTAINADKIAADVGEIDPNPEVDKKTKKLLKYLLEQTTGESYETYGQDFTSYCNEWVESRRLTTAKATWAKYNQTVESFVESLPPNRRTASVSSINAAEVRRHRDGLVREGVSESTVNVRLAILRSLFGDAQAQGLTAINAAKAVQKLNAEVVGVREPFTDEQIGKLLAVSDSEWRGMILLGCWCGMRMTDAATLKWRNIDLQEGLITYRQTKIARKRKAHQKDTVVAMHTDLVSYFEKIVPSTDDPDAAAFPALCGLSTGGSAGLSARFAKIMQAAGIVAGRGAQKEGSGREFRTLSYHSLRHSFCSRLANSGVAPEIRKTMSGHSSDLIHEKYSHLGLGLQRSAIAKLGSVLT